jgi:hypothetical protein
MSVKSYSSKAKDFIFFEIEMTFDSWKTRIFLEAEILYSSVAERMPSKHKVLSSILNGGIFCFWGSLL